MSAIGEGRETPTRASAPDTLARLVTGFVDFRTGLPVRRPLQRGTKPLHARSPKRAAQERKYAKLRAEFLAENSRCEFPACPTVATDAHHAAGRVGSDLLRRELFVALCRPHHRLVTENPTRAKELGLSLDRIGRSWDTGTVSRIVRGLSRVTELAPADGGDAA